MTKAHGHILVTGSKGMLGTDLLPSLRAKGYTVSGCDLPDVDITSTEQLAASLENCDAVVNCAAYTNVDGAEADEETADAVNRRAVGELGRLAAERDLYVLHISTDFVFDGTLSRPYRETDPPNPINVYGKTKLQGEQELARAGCRYAVMRVQWTYGAGGNNFITKFLERTKKSGKLMMVADQIGTPTWTKDAAQALTELLQRQAEGLYHYAAAGYATRYDVAQAVLEETGQKQRELTPCKTADFPAAAQRPLDSRFDCSKIDDLLGRPRPHWRRALADFISRELNC